MMATMREDQLEPGHAGTSLVRELYMARTGNDRWLCGTHACTLKRSPKLPDCQIPVNSVACLDGRTCPR